MTETRGFGQQDQSSISNDVETSLLDGDDYSRVLVDWNATESKSDFNRCIHEVFHSLVAASPDAVAVRHGTQSVSYKELDKQANRLARYLVAQGVGPNVCVAMCLSRSIDTIVAVLGILKAGGAYMPLESTYPAERLAFMLKDARAPFIITDRTLGAGLPDYTKIYLHEAEAAIVSQSDTDVERRAAPEDLAYVMYTSGSTGTPKGVEVPHRAVVRLACNPNFVELGPQHATLHAAPLAFDASTFEIWGALLNGGVCVLYPERVPTAQGLRAVVAQYGVTTVWLTAALFNAIVDEDPSALEGIRQLLTGGEALSVPHVVRALNALPNTRLINGYGPTETTTFAVCNTIPRDLSAKSRSVPIGKAIQDTQLFVLDAQLRPVALGAVGELYIGGKGVARGYLNRPELTNERFIKCPFAPFEGSLLYKTGDLVRYLPDGLLDYIGRIDNQVKIRGYRIELGEIEACIGEFPQIRACAVLAREDRPGDKRLVAYVVSNTAGQQAPIPDLRAHIRRSLPDYMVPATFVWLDSLPITDNGKLDRRALPIPEPATHARTTDYVAPKSAEEVRICEVFAAVIGVEGVGRNDNFFDLGGNSLLVLRAATQLRELHGYVIPVLKFFEHPTPAGLATVISGASGDSAAVIAIAERARTMHGRASSGKKLDDIAIIGMAGRFPGASNVDKFWQNLCDGVESITYFGKDGLDPSIDPELRNHPNYVAARGIIDNVDQFDAGFFSITPREASLIDPQQRVFLELVWEALEHAGYVPEQFDGTIGVFAGTYNSSYFANNVATRPDLIEQMGAFQVMLLNEKDYVATRAAYKLNLTGPAVSMQSACSTSLSTVVQAVQALQLGQCDMALAGGVSIVVPVRSGYLYQESGMLSADGHCRPFDAHATGTTFGDGAAVVTLKRLTDAVADGDTVYAVIRGAAVNNDGANKASYTAPSVKGQAAVIALAHANAEVDPRSISYVETHGTATPMGDPIEIEALNLAFQAGTQEKQFCRVGSLKSNVGHLVIAAGAASLIKTALALKSRKLPPSLFYEAPNPQIDFANSPFLVNSKLHQWEGAFPLRAGVSSFGVGGANAHIVVEEAAPGQPCSATRPLQILPLSARSSAALDKATERLSEYLKGQADVALCEAAFTLARGRKAFAERRFVVAADNASAARELANDLAKRTASHRFDGQVPDVAFQFPGQGAQFVGMGKALYDGEPAFRAVVDLCAEFLKPILSLDLRAILYPKPGDEESAAEQLKSTEITQPALFVISYAMASLLQHWGIRPNVMIGHSIGEFVCATLASVFSLEDALRLVAQRGLAMKQMPPGAMLSVRMSAADLAAHIRDNRISIAAHNAPLACVASGPFDAIEVLERELTAKNVSCRTLQTSHAFHSSMMQPAADAFEKVVASVNLSAPQLPFISTATGELITDAEATSPKYWASHLRNTVRFADGTAKLLENPRLVFVEVGPRMTLTTLVRLQGRAKTSAVCIATIGDKPDATAEWTSVLSCLGQLWLRGLAVNWQSYYADEKRRRIPLPTYPFERQRHWIDAVPRSAKTAPLVTNAIQANNMVTSPPAAPASVAAAVTNPQITGVNVSTAAVVSSSVPSRVKTYVEELKAILEEASGIEVSDADLSTSFLYLGLDSLFLTQIALNIQKRFGLKLGFRQLIEEYPSIQELAEHMDRELPPDPNTSATSAAVVGAAQSAPAATPAVVAAPSVQSPAIYVPPAAGQPMPIGWPGAMAPIAPSGTISGLIEQQLRLMQQQLALLAGAPQDVAASAGAAVTATHSVANVPAQPQQSLTADAPPALSASTATQSGGNGAGSTVDASPATGDSPDPKKTFGAMTKISLSHGDELTPGQKSRLDAFVRRYNSRTASSKRLTQQNRARLADPRVVSGFRPVLKELVYPLIVERSSGSKFWDVDGNEYVDVQCGFGSCFFGWSPPFVIEAIKAQLDRGIEIGPQHPLAGEVAHMFCEMTGAERAAFCNTGSEAVMGSLRMARTVTGRRMVATFTGDYHGIFDEVIVRGTKKLRSVPAAPGIMPSTAENILVIDYGTPESLEILRANASELAAVLVEPVQSRRPDWQPGDFLKEVRKITEASGTALIFDEVVTGFRVGPGGAQEHFGVRADIGTYGKVVGGGLSIGVIAGKRKFMDALDGGDWQFGDDSAPTVGVTYFAGTFVRHPAALAAAKAVLTHLKEQGPELQLGVARKVEKFADEMNEYFAKVEAPIHIAHFSSIWKPSFTEDLAFGELLSAFMRDAGIHIRDGFPCFFTTAHSDEDIARVANAFKSGIAEMQASGFMPGKSPDSAQPNVTKTSEPPVPGARLGRDPDGNPAWYAPHPTEAGKYVRVGAAN